MWQLQLRSSVLGVSVCALIRRMLPSNMKIDEQI